MQYTYFIHVSTHLCAQNSKYLFYENILITVDLLSCITGLYDAAYTWCQHLFPPWLLPQKTGLVFMPGFVS